MHTLGGRQRLRSKAFHFAWGLAVVSLSWGTGLLYFVEKIPTRVMDIDTSTDAIVILTGGSERLNTGLRLLAQNKAERVFVSGVHQSVDVERLMQLAGCADGNLQRRIEAGYEARDTRGNAEETATWMRERGFRSLRLVTSSYHMPRSLMEFQMMLPEAKVISHPVFPKHIKPTSWWLSPKTGALIIGEYNKYLLAVLKHRWDALFECTYMSNGR